METQTILGDSSVTIDEALMILGGYSQFQWLLNAFLCFMSPPRVFQVLLTMFTAIDSPWRCAVNSSVCLLNGSLPTTNQYRCDIPRTEWEYTIPKDYSITTEFGLHCDNEWKKHLLTSILFVGWGVGAVVLSWLADNYGRKKVIFLSQTIIVVAGFTCSFANSVSLLIFFRFLIGFFLPGGLVQSYILITEYVSTKQRHLAMLPPALTFTIGLCLLALQAYFIRNWRLLSIVCTAPYFITLFTFKFIPESARWLRLKNKEKELMNIFRRISFWNKKELPADMKIIPSDDKVHRIFSPMELFRTRKIAFISLNQGYTWFVNGMVYYGLTLAAGDLGGSLYLNFTLLSIVDVPSTFLCLYLCNRIGRRNCVVITMIISSVCCLLVGFIPLKDSGRIFRVIAGMVGKCCIGMSFGGIYLWGVELYPTSIRAMGMGFLQVTSRVGAAAAPWVVAGLIPVHRSLPFILMSVTAFIAAVLSALIPETKGKPTLETNEDMNKDAANQML